LQGSNASKLSTLKEILQGSEVGQKGIDEMDELFHYIEAWGSLSTQVELDLSLARGLNYYTGAIFEVKALDVEMGSICGGGRYDDLTGIFGLPNVSGVGVSFGADRIYDVMQQLNLFPKSLTSTTQVMFANFGSAEVAYCMPAARLLRDEGLSVEIYPDAAKVKKQFEYANKRNIRFMVIAGEAEMQNGNLSVKKMETGQQITIPFGSIVTHIKSNL
jgi:histidyl-tRNA synthetase